MRSKQFAFQPIINQAGHLRPSAPKLGCGALPGIIRMCTKAAHRRDVSTATYSRQKDTAQTNSSGRASVHSSKTRRSPRSCGTGTCVLSDVRTPGKSAIERRSSLRPTRKPVDWKWSETGFQNSLRTSVAGDSDTTQISHQKKNLDIDFNKTALFRKNTRKELQDHAAKTQDTSVDPLRTRRWP